MKLSIKFFSLFIVVLLLPSISFAQLLEDVDPNPTSQCLILRNNLKYGMDDKQMQGDISGMQSLLREMGFLSKSIKGIGYFGYNTIKAVKNFQNLRLTNVDENSIDTSIIPNKEERHSLAVNGFRLSNSGYVGKYTRAKIAYVSCHDATDTAVPTSTNQSTTQSSVYTTSTTSSTSTGSSYIIRGRTTSSTMVDVPIHCGNYTAREIALSYYPDSNGVVSFDSNICKQKGVLVWAGCPSGQFPSVPAMAVDSFNGKTITCSTSDTTKTAVSISVADPYNSNSAIFSASNCVIPVNGSTCPSTVTASNTTGAMLDIFNVTRVLAYTNAVWPTPSVGTISTKTWSGATIYGDSATYLTYGSNTLQLQKSDQTVLATATVWGSCFSGSAWDGKKCATTDSSVAVASSVASSLAYARTRDLPYITNTTLTKIGSSPSAGVSPYYEITPGTSVTLHGERFTGSKLYIGTKEIIPTTISDTSMTFVVPTVARPGTSIDSIYLNTVKGGSNSIYIQIVSTVTGASSSVPAGACLFDEKAYRDRGYHMTVTSSDNTAWLEANNVTVVSGKIYLLDKPGIMWSLWDTTNKLTQAMLSCQNGVITETGMPAPKKVLTADEQLAITEADIKQKCANGTYPSKYSVCQPPEKRLQYLKDQFAQAKKPMSQATRNSFGPGFTDSQLAFADWNYVTVGPFVVSCDELVTTYNFYWLKDKDGNIGNWASNSNRDFYDTNGKFVGTGGAMLSTTQYKDKITGESMTEPDISYSAIGNCNHSGVVASTTSPTLSVYRSQANNQQTLSWNSKNISSLTYSCLDSNNKSTGEVAVAINLATTTTPWAELRQNGWSGTYHCSWKANGTTIVATETFTIPSTNTTSSVNTIPTTNTSSPSSVLVQPTINVVRLNQLGDVGSSYKVTWTTTNAATVGWSCVASPNGGYSGSGAFPDASGNGVNGSVTGIYTESMLGTSRCTWHATSTQGVGPFGVFLENFTVVCPVGKTQVGKTCVAKIGAVSNQTPAVLGAFTTSCVDIPKNIHRGSESVFVSKLQDFLIGKGLLTEQATGFYGDKTVTAVKDYQSENGLPVTGMVYDFTRNVIREETCN